MGKQHSIMTDCMDFCVICGRPKQHIHHCIYGSRRKLADEDGLVVPVCAECHSFIHEVPMVSKQFKEMAQIKYEEEHTREEFLERYGKNYIGNY